MPVIVITGYRGIRMTVRAMKAGAVELLTKPFSDEALLVAIRQALARSGKVLKQVTQIRELRECYRLLTSS